MTDPTLNAAQLYDQLLAQIRHYAAQQGQALQLLGVWSGGAWLVEQLHRDLGWPGEPGVISSQLHRDDFAQRGMHHAPGPTRIPFDVEGAHVLLVDDVLQTGRTVRAVLNELFDFGRPARVSLAVLVDRGGRELPVAPDLAACTLPPSDRPKISLVRDPSGALKFEEI